MATCFHHTERETGRACTRCGRPACPDCLHQAQVGSHCFECVGAARPAPAERLRQASRIDLAATKAIIALNVAVFVVLLAANRSTSELEWALNGPAIADGEWYRLATSGFIHYGALHLAFNMFILYQVGRVLEAGVGSARFVALYAVSLLAGSAGALLLEPAAFTGGASGAVFGVAGAATIALQQRGVRFWDTGFGPLLAFNLLLTFTLPNVSVGGHLGGLAAGTASGAILVGPRSNHVVGFAVTVLVGVAAVMVSLSVV